MRYGCRQGVHAGRRHLPRQRLHRVLLPGFLGERYGSPIDICLRSWADDVARSSQPAFTISALFSVSISLVCVAANFVLSVIAFLAVRTPSPFVAHVTYARNPLRRTNGNSSFSKHSSCWRSAFDSF